MRRGLVALALAGLSVGAFASTFTENFDGGNAGGLPSGSWFSKNNSNPAPSGAFAGVTPWVNGVNALFTPQAGNGYIATSYQRTSNENGTGDLSVWLLTPQFTWVNGDTVSFWSRSLDTNIPDRLEVRLGSNGSDTNVGSLSTDVGTYTNLLLTINPTLSQGGYPQAWTQYNITVSGLSGSVTSRLAFRYFVTNGGALGNNSDYIGVDTLTINNAVPEPASMAVLGVGAIGVLLRRRKR